MSQLEGRFVVEREAVRRTRHIKKETKDQHEHMRTGAPTCSVMSVAPKEILACAALALNEQLGHDKMAINR